MERALRKHLAGGAFANVDPVHSRRMASIRGKDTGPEMIVRKTVHRLGHRYRLHAPGLPGRPDLVLTKLRKVIFVHGCFWHRHACLGGRMPKSRAAFWRAKLEGNRERDRRHARHLRALGWDVLVVWECQVKDVDRLARRLTAFLSR